MILSHRHRFLFIKTNKTAGTSIEIALSKFCGPDDIITPISEEDERIRHRLGYRGPQNHEGFYNHIGAREIMNRVDPEVWNGYYKFCVERNPWDRAVSLYYFLYRNKTPVPFADFVASDTIHRLRENGFENYTVDGEIVVDRICLYERLDEELEAVRKHLGLPEPLALPRAKAGFRKDGKHYRELFDDASRRRIERLCAEEIERFGYRF